MKRITENRTVSKLKFPLNKKTVNVPTMDGHRENWKNTPVLLSTEHVSRTHEVYSLQITENSVYSGRELENLSHIC